MANGNTARRSGRASKAARLAALLWLATAGPQPARATDASALGAAGAAMVPQALRADFAGAAASADARQVADWALASGDHQGLPFLIVDKAAAEMFLFAADGILIGAAPVLLGLGRGDDSPPGIGARALSLMAPAERITPAGRFVAGLGLNLSGQDIIWVDYEAAVSIHRTSDPIPGLTATGRAARLASTTIRDNRVSHGCINVSTAFFEQQLRPAFAGTSGIVYVLPETRPIRAAFPIPA
jgi:hypothetical protein